MKNEIHDIGPCIAKMRIDVMRHVSRNTDPNLFKTTWDELISIPRPIVEAQQQISNERLHKLIVTRLSRKVDLLEAAIRRKNVGHSLLHPACLMPWKQHFPPLNTLFAMGREMRMGIMVPVRSRLMQKDFPDEE